MNQLTIRDAQKLILLMDSVKQRPGQFLLCQQATGLSGSECSAQCHSCIILSLATFLLSNDSSSERSGALAVGSVEFYTGDVQIQLFINQNVDNALTFGFFALEWWSSPSVSLLNSITMTNFILQVDFFLFFRVSGTTNGLSLLHIDPNDICEFRSNGSNFLFSLLKWYWSCSFDGNTLSASAAFCWKSYQVIEDGRTNSCQLPLALSSTSKVI